MILGFPDVDKFAHRQLSKCRHDISLGEGFHDFACPRRLLALDVGQLSLAESVAECGEGVARLYGGRLVAVSDQYHLDLGFGGESEQLIHLPRSHHASLVEHDDCLVIELRLAEIELEVGHLGPMNGTPKWCVRSNGLPPHSEPRAVEVGEYLGEGVARDAG